MVEASVWLVGGGVLLVVALIFILGGGIDAATSFEDLWVVVGSFLRPADYGLFVDSVGFCLSGDCITSWSGVSVNESDVEGYIFDADNTGSLTTTGSLSANNLTASGYISATGNLTASNLKDVGVSVAIGTQAGNFGSANRQTAVGYQSGQSSSGTQTTFVGYKAGYYASAGDSTFIGADAGGSSTASNSVAIGTSAGLSALANFTVVIGGSSGASNTGNYITAVGYRSGYQNKNESQTAVGYTAGFQNVGYRQTALGREAGYSNSGAGQTALGYIAGRENTGSYQTALGYYSGYQNTGNYAVSTGYTAGQNNSGDNIVVLGYQAGNGNAGDDVVALGYQAGKDNPYDDQFIVRQANINSVPLIQGNFSSGNVGIGTNSPSFPLTVGSNSSGGNVSVWATGEVHASAFVTHTSTYDYDRWGSALQYVGNASDYRGLGGRVNYDAYAPSRVEFVNPVFESVITGYVNVSFEDCSVFVFEDYWDTALNISGQRSVRSCVNVSRSDPVYESVFVRNDTVVGVDLQAEINLLKQAVFELKTAYCADVVSPSLEVC